MTVEELIADLAALPLEMEVVQLSDYGVIIATPPRVRELDQDSDGALYWSPVGGSAVPECSKGWTRRKVVLL